jgi:hypothetical protein
MALQSYLFKFHGVNHIFKCHLHVANSAHAYAWHWAFIIRTPKKKGISSDVAYFYKHVVQPFPNIHLGTYISKLIIIQQDDEIRNPYLKPRVKHQEDKIQQQLHTFYKWKIKSVIAHKLKIT